MTDAALADWEATHGWPPGEQEVICVPNPLPGLGFTHTIPGAVTQEILGVSFTLTTAGGGGARTATVRYLDSGGVPFARILCPFTQAGGVTAVYTFAVGVQQVGVLAGTAFVIPLPPWRLDLVSGIDVFPAGAAAGDQMSDCRLFVEQWNVRP